MKTLKSFLWALTSFLMIMALLTIGLIWAVGATGLIIGASVTGLIILVLASFAIGSWWTRSSMESGARLAIESTSRNDQCDTQKITAITALAREMVKVQNEHQKALPVSQLPALPLPGNMVEGSFTIAGLDEEMD